VFFGVYPMPDFNVTTASVDQLLSSYTAAIEAASSVASIQK
jgi:NADH-quinone oxidoreductase subunit M